MGARRINQEIFDNIKVLLQTDISKRRIGRMLGVSDAVVHRIAKAIDLEDYRVTQAAERRVYHESSKSVAVEPADEPEEETKSDKVPVNNDEMVLSALQELSYNLGRVADVLETQYPSKLEQEAREFKLFGRK